MGDCISRAALLAAYDAAHVGPPGGARKLIEEAPAADVVPVVRCKDCKYQNSPFCHMCHEEYYVDEDDGGDYYLIDKAVDPNGFCSYGERKEAEGDG